MAQIDHLTQLTDCTKLHAYLLKFTGSLTTPPMNLTN